MIGHSRSVLMIGDFTSAAPMRHFATAFRDAGFFVMEVPADLELSAAGSRSLNLIVDRLHPKLKLKSLARRIINDAKSIKPDIVFFAKGCGATPDTLVELNRLGAVTVNWYPDFHFDHPFVDRASLSMFDVMITTKAFQMDYLEDIRGGKPSFLVEHGYCDNIHTPIDPAVPDQEKPFDVIFVGNHSSYKGNWISKLCAIAPQLKVAIIGGKQWAGERHRLNSNVVINGYLDGQQMARAFGHARIALAIHHGPAGREGWQDDVSARTFEIPSCKCFMLHIDSPHVRTLYDVPGEIDVFSSAEQAVEKILHYLPRPELRAEMVERAYRRAVPAYGYRAAGARIVDICQGAISKMHKQERIQ